MIKKLKCFFGRHKYKVIEILSVSSKKIECINCKRHFAINYDAKVILPCDKDFEEIYQFLAKYKVS